MKKSEFFISFNSPRVFTFFLFFLFCAGRLTAATWYVKPTGSDASAGNSWAAAYQTLTKALQSAASGDQIWVAAGTYKPTTGTDRGVSFNMKNGVAILGGFPATGNPVLADRDWETHVTTLSGDIGAAGDNSDNSYNIIANVNNGLTASAILDGFTVTGGNANGEAFVNWFGGGMYLGSSSPTIRNCIFSNNNALYGGGGVAAFESSATISACVFNGNYSAQNGGGLGLYGNTISVINCVFTGNSAASFGAAVYSGTSNNATLTNCSFSGNSGYCTILNAESTFNLKNGIIWENNGDVIYNFNGTMNVSNSIVQGGYAGNGNLNVDPLFVDQANGDLRLQTCSPAINKGSNAAVPAGVTTDLDGNNRFFGTVDMGAYEQGTPPVLAVCKNITVQLDATGNVTVPASAVDNGSTVACGIAILTLSKTNFNCSNVGNPLVSLEVKDNDGNKAYCSTTITVQDNIAPTALCKNATVQLDATGNVTVPGSAVDNGSSDVCGIAALTLSKTNFNCSNVGSLLVSLEVRDNSGNKAYCSATLTVQDNIAPTAVCQNTTVQLDASGNVTVPVTAINNGSTDACGIASLSLSKTTFNCSNTGANTVTLTATDNNGKTATCSATVTVQDNTAPSVICPQDIPVAPDPNSPCTAFVEEGLEATVNDNCTANLTYQFSGALTGSGVSQVPATTFPSGVTTVTYTVADGGQNSAQCAFHVTVGSCGIAVSGKLIWENDDASGVGNALVNLDGDESASVTTGTDGLFSFNVGQGADVVLIPAKTINKLNGVTTADATRIQQHVANINLITDPYKLVAADVNKTNSVTSLDASIINQALLGNPAALAQFKTSWRFVPVSYNLSLPPWGFPDNIYLESVQGNMTEQNFFGIKTGDVIAPSTNPANFNGSDASGFVLSTADQVLQFGEQIAVVFSADQFSDLAALQFALKFDVEKLALAGIEPLGGMPVSEENFGIYNISEGAIHVVWSQAGGVYVEEAAPVFRLTFNVLETGGKLSEALHLAGEVLEGHAYTSALADNKVNLQFFGTTGIGDPAVAQQVELLQNQPNPFSGTTTIAFVLPQASEAQLRVYDSGRLLWERKGNYPAGRSEVIFEANGATGILYYELTTSFGVVSRKMSALR